MVLHSTCASTPEYTSRIVFPRSSGRVIHRPVSECRRFPERVWPGLASGCAVTRDQSEVDSDLTDPRRFPALMLVSLVRQRLSLRVGYFENEFSSILALEELQQRFGKCFETLYDVLARFEFASRHPRRHLPCGLRVTISVVKYDHTLHAGAINEKR